MKKTTLRQAALKLAIVAIALFAPLGLRAQETLTVNDGTATNEYVPIYGLYVDTHGQNSEFIIPAETQGMSDMEGGTISKLAFYITNSPATWGSPTVQVYMGVVESTTLSSLNGPTNFTTVWTGTLSNQSDTMEITLSDPYTYEGGNLLIGMYVQTASNTYKNTSFSGIIALSGSSRSNNGSGPGTAKSFLPKTTFTYEPASQGGCDKPETVTPSQITPNTAMLNWQGGSTPGNGYNVEIKGGQYAEWTRYASNISQGCLLNHLIENTAYQARVQVVCSTTDSSTWKSTSFTTPAYFSNFNVEIIQGEGNKAVFSWTENGFTPSDWQLCINGDENNLISMTSNPFTYNGLTPEVATTAKMRAFVGDNTGAWSNTATFTPTNSYFITVNDSTATNGYVPIYGYYVDNITKSQFIIPANALADMVYGTINKMTFYAEADKNWGNAQFEVYMTETNETTISALADYGTMEKVKNAGSLSISGNKMVVEFDAPYQYMGGNLMIGFLQTATGTYSSCNWYGITATGASMGGYGTSINQQNFLPKTKFEYLPGEAPACFKPTGLSVNYTGGTTAEVSWTSDAALFNIDVNGTVTEGVNNPYTIENLDLATNYEVKVQAVCDGTPSDWTNAASFTTDLCMPENQCQLSYELNLTNQYYNGWYYGASINVVDVATSSVIATLTSSGSSANGTVNVCDGREIRFEWNNGTYYNNYCTYTITDVNDEVVLSGSGSFSTPVTHTVSCTLTDCRKPSNLTATGTTAHSTQLSWTENGVGEEAVTSWVLAYKAPTDEDFTEVTVNTNENYSLNNLAQSTTYTWKVRSEGCEDKWSNTTTFTTNSGHVTPTGLAVSDVSNNSATASWTGAATNDLHESYDIYYSQLSTMPEELNQDSLFTGHDEATYTFEDLTPSTGYFVWVRDNCGTDGYSGWVGPVSFTTQAACPAPELNATGITNVTAHTANVEWSNFEANDSYVVSYRSAESINTNGGLYEDFNSLNTAYSIPEGWSNDEGTTSEASYKWFYNTATSSSGATNGTSHDGSNCLRFDSYNNSSNKTNFLQTPSMDFPAGETMMLSFWWKNPNAGDFSVYISTDGGTTKNPIAEGLTGQSTWTQATYELTDYVGASNVTIHFKGTSNYGYGDAYIYLDDIMVGYTVPAGEWETEELTENSIELTGLVAETTYEVKVKGLCSGDQENESDIQTFRTTVACPVPTGLDTVGDATDNSVDLTWTAGAANQDAWQICLNGDETNLLNVTDATVTGTTVTYTLTGLTAGADYSVKVRANCGIVDGVSLQWTNTVNFTTEASCTEPTDFAVVENSVEAHQAQLSWTAGGVETAWDICYSNTNSAPVNGVTEPTIEGVTENNPYTLIGLTDARTYYVWVRAHCGDAAGQQSPWVGPVSFSTPQEAVTAPYADNFENGNNWLLVNGNLTNAWAYGEADNNGGTHALYISNDGGITNAYTINSSALVYATKLITFEEGTYKFSYDWKANGESTWDYLRVALVPATTTLTAGTSVPTDFSTTLPTGWTALDGGNKLNQVTEWQRYESAEMPIDSGTYMMVFAWRNDGSQGTNPPAAIDNVSIEKITCIAPTALDASNISAHTATLAWTAGADEEAWQIAYSTTEGFDPDTVTPVGVITNPATINGLTQSTTYYAYVRAKCGEDDYSYWSNMTDFTTISGKQAPTGLAVSDIASATATATWTGVTTNVRHESYELYYSKLSSMPETLNVDSLITGITETSFEFTGLTPETGYHVWVRDICGTDGESEWTSTSFTTLPSCPTPTALAATNITNNAATISWTGSSDVANYTVQYRTAEDMNVVFSEGFENGIGSWTLTDCHNSTGISTSDNYSGSNCFMFYYNSNPPQYLISPELTLDETATLEFYYKNKSTSWPETFKVGFSSTNSGTDAFDWGEEVTASDIQWHLYSVDIPVNTKYMAIQYTSNNQFYLYIDDIVIGTPVAVGEWIDATEDVAAESFTIEGLEAETKYDVQVKSNCTNGEYSAPYTFTTASVFTKSIEANKWYAIATPAHDCVKTNNAVAVANVHNLTTAANDLYSYDEANGSWMAASDSMMTGTGYIYRSAADAELGFVGYANTGSVSVSITSSTTTDPDLKGFNLIGNPYPHTVAVSRDFYTLEPEGTWMAKTSGNTITAAEACLVQTTYSITYTFNDVIPNTSSKSNSNTALAFTVSNGEYSDVAYARLEEGEGLPKIGHLAANAPMLSIPVEGRRYAVANVGSDCESFDMVFRGTGTYTLSFNGNTGYCHLIDRVAGKDIDMLRQNYTFSSNGFDADRFTVKLSPDAQENANGNFAYWNGNVWMVEGNGTLQVFDALGRQLLSQEISNSNFEIQNSLFPAAGVYVLRMGEKTQKIVVR